MGISFRKGQVKWLLGELPELQKGGVIDASVAQALHEHYSHGIMEASPQSRNLAVLLLSVLGSLLIGGGVIMLLAHNWDELPKSLRLGMAFLPLLIAQGIGGFSLWKDKSLSWRECAGVLTPLSVIAVISIVAQVYNISGDPIKFYLAVTLLSLPVMYIYRSTVAALLCMAMVGMLGLELFNNCSSETSDLWKYWICLAILIPFVVFMFRKHSQTMRSFWLAIGCIVLLIFQSCYALDGCDMMSMPIFGMLASMLWLLGRTSQKNYWAKGFKSIALLGLMLVFILASFDGFWEIDRFRRNPFFIMEMPLWWYGYIWLLLSANVLLLLRVGLRREWLSFLPGLSGVIMLVTMILCGVYDLYTNCDVYAHHASAALTTNVIGFFGGVVVMLLAIRQGKILEMNFGMLLASLILVIRFFDSEYGFTLKGIAFILVGVLFLMINFMMVRKFRRIAK